MNNDNNSGKGNIVTSTQPGSSDVTSQLAPPPPTPSNITPTNLLQSSSDSAVSPNNVLNTLHVILNHTHLDLVVKELPQGSLANTVSKNEYCCHPNSCPPINMIKTRGKRVRDNSISSWDDIWLPISQFEFNNDNSVTFNFPLLTIRLDELYICLSRMTLM